MRPGPDWRGVWTLALRPHHVKLLENWHSLEGMEGWR